MLCYQTLCRQIAHLREFAPVKRKQCSYIFYFLNSRISDTFFTNSGWVRQMYSWYWVVWWCPVSVESFLFTGLGMRPYMSDKKYTNEFSPLIEFKKGDKESYSDYTTSIAKFLKCKCAYEN